MIGSFLRNDNDEICLVLISPENKINSVVLAAGKICIIEKDNDEEEIFTEEIHDEIYNYLCKQAEVLIVIFDQQNNLIEEYKVLLKLI